MSWKGILTSAAEEARRRGDRRLGTDHLLLGLLHDQASPTAAALGVSLERARSASDALDKEALHAVGVEVEVEQLAGTAPAGRARRLPPLTSGARAVIKSTINQAHPKNAAIDEGHFLLAILDRDRPDPAAELLRALGIEPAAVRARISAPV
jgi:ATP-dependent Clp protease ATP-binding subunit ClpA